MAHTRSVEIVVDYMRSSRAAIWLGGSVCAPWSHFEVPLYCTYAPVCFITSTIVCSPDTLPSSPLHLSRDRLLPAPLKLALVVEAQAWKQAYGRSLNAHYRTKMEKIVHFVTEYQKKLSRPVQDLEDVRLMMAALTEIRDGEIGIDLQLIPVEVRGLCVPMSSLLHLLMLKYVVLL